MTLKPCPHFAVTIHINLNYQSDMGQESFVLPNCFLYMRGSVNSNLIICFIINICPLTERNLEQIILQNIS